MVSNFSAGMNKLMDATKLSEGEYPLLINGRTRFNSVKPIKRPVLLEGLLPGLIQGIYSTTDWILVFVAGTAYYRNYSAYNSAFIQVPDFAMDPTTPTIYAEAVPQSRVLGVRQASGSDSTDSVILQPPIGSQASPSCIVCQDGINQPWIINSNGTARVTQSIAQWLNPDAREYVPIGKQMMYYNGVLFIVSPDGKMLFRSVSGRPLDFVIAIDTNGDKLVADGSTADKMAHTVDYSSITAVRSLGAFDGAFFVSTSRQSYQVAPVTDGSLPMIYGEPVYRNIPLFPTGALNQFSVVDLLGDTAIIDYAGIRSYNAVMQLRNTGKNSPFSAKIQSLFITENGDTLVQDQPCCVEFDNYAFFSLNTVFGPALMVYDCINQCWCGLDIYAGLGTIKYMTVVQTLLTRKLLFATSTNHVYEAFASPEDFETCSLYVGEFASGDTRSELKPVRLRLVMSDVVENGSVYAKIYSDRVEGLQHSEVLHANNPAQTYPMLPPFGNVVDDTEKNASFDLGREATAWKHGFFLQWAFNATLSRVGFEAEACVQANNIEQSAENEIAVQSGMPYIDSVLPLAVIPTQVVIIRGRGFLSVLSIRINDTYLSSFTRYNDSTLSFVTPAAPAGDYVLTLITNVTEVEAADKFTIVIS